MSTKFNCHCNIPCKEVKTQQGKLLLKCGEDISYEDDRLGCNFMVYKPQAKDFNRHLKSIRKTYKSFKKFPVCDHNIKANLRITSEKAKNPDRPFFCCSVKAPDSSCDFFKWADVGVKRSLKVSKKQKKSAKMVSDESSSDDDSDEEEISQRKLGKKKSTKKNKFKKTHQQKPSSRQQSDNEDGNESESLFSDSDDVDR